MAGFCALALVLAYVQGPAEARWRSANNPAIFVDDEPPDFDGSPSGVCERGITFILANDFTFDDSSPPSGPIDDQFDLVATTVGGTEVIARLKLVLPVDRITDDGGTERWYSREYALTWSQELAPGTEVELDFESTRGQEPDFSFTVTVRSCPGDWRERSVDFRPGSSSKAFDCQSTTPIPLAVLSRRGFGITFDATQIADGTVRFGPRGIEAARVSTSNSDVNGDGLVDAVFNIRPALAGCRKGTTRIFIIGGSRNNGFTFFGSAPVTTSNCPK